MLIHAAVRPRLRRPAPVAALCCLALPATAVAAVPATPIAGRTIDAVPVSLGFDGAGNAVASWRGLRGPSADEARPYAALAGRARTGAWRAGPPLPASVVAHDLAVSQAGVIALASAREQPLSNSRSRSSIVLNVGDSAKLSLSGPLVLARGPARPVSYEGPQPSLLAPRAAIAPNGRIVVAWLRGYPRSQTGVWVAVRRPGGDLGRPRLLDSRGGAPQLALDRDGSGYVAWQRGRRVLSRRLSAAGRWGPLETVATAPATPLTQLESLAITTSRGRFAAAAVATRRSASGVRVRVSAHVRTRTAGWRSTRLGDYSFQPTGQTAFVTDALRALPLITTDDRIRVAWPALRDGNVRAAVTRLQVRRTGLAAVETAALSGAGLDVALEDAAVGPSGRFAVTWFDLAEAGGSPNLAEVGPAGPVGATSRLAGERALRGSRVAYDPSSAAPAVLWSEGASPQGYRPLSWTSVAP